MVNLIGLGMDDPHAADDVEALRAMLAPQAALGAVLSRCTLEEVRRAPYADVNLVLRGKGRELAQAMKEYFGIPWEELDYPYGAAGADDLWSRLERRFGLDYHQARAELDRQIAEGAGKAYRYLQALYGMPAAILASGPRADGRSSPTRRTSTGSCAAPRRRFCSAPPLSRTVPTSWKFR